MLAGVAVALWSIGEERRLGRVVASLVRTRTGLSITVGAASATSEGLTLHDVRFPAAPGLPLDLQAQRVEVSGGWLPLVTPRAGPVSIRAVAAGFTAAFGEGRTPAMSEVLDGLRAFLGPLLAWPGRLAFRMEGAEVWFGGRPWVADVSADKNGARLGLVAAFAPADDEGGIAAGATGRGVVIQAVGRGAPDTGFEVSRFAIQAGPDVHLQGTAALRWRGGGPGLSAEAEGRVAGGRLVGRAAWADDGLVIDATLSGVDLAALGARLGLAVPAPLEARHVRVRWEGTSRHARARVDASGVTSGAGSDIALDASLDAAVRGGWPLPPASVETAQVTVRRGFRTLLRATLASRHAATLWPLDVRGTVEDPAALAALGPVPATATGTVTVTAEV
ncbi:MAG: hypothetical protein K6T92_03345, partial [Candidatus Rokubacteria bacterium]|nr:hypothetical protein [Candidatus Rokubacteria bacterium]